MNLFFILKIFILALLLFYWDCGKNEKKNGETFVFNEKARYSDKEFITFEKLYDIDADKNAEYFIKHFTWMDVDKDTNLYILDIIGCKFTVFDNMGKFLREFGRKGFGPKELNGPSTFYVFNDMLYVYENARGIKIWSLMGDYKGYIASSQAEGMALYKPFDRFYFGLSAIPKELGKGGKFQEWNLSKYSSDLNGRRKIAAVITQAHDNNKYFDLRWMLSNDSNHNLYFPVNRDEYIINKYDVEGNLIVSFGRKYSPKPYSQKTIDAYNKYYEKEILLKLLFPRNGYPQIIRNIKIDEHDYIWISVGESNIDNMYNASITNTIDLFDVNGKWIFSFKWPEYWGGMTVIKNDRIYTLPTVYDRFVHVYKIKYNL